MHELLARALTGLVIGAAAAPVLLLVVRRCSNTRPARWHTVILFAGSVTTAAAMASWPWQLWPAGAALLLMALPAATVDLVEKRVPDVLSFPLAATALLAVAVPAALDGSIADVARAAAAGLAWAALLFVLLLAAGHPGPGDVKYALGLGVVLGSLGWSALAAGAALTYLLTALAILPLLALRRMKGSDSVPLGPGMLAATLIVATTTVMP